MKSPLKGYILVNEEDYKALLSNLARLQEANENLQKTVNEQNLKIQVLTKRIEELESQLHQNSQNSHRSPSTDAFKKPIKNSREPSNKKQGGQKGHEGRTLKMVENPDKIVEHKVSGKCQCGRDLNEIGVERIIRKQEFELPEKLIEVIEHQIEVKKCECGKLHYGECDLKGNTQYGNKLKGFMTYLNQYQYIPYERLQEMMMDYFNIPVGDGTIEASSELMYKNLEETEAFIKQELINSKVNHNDESGIRCEKKLKWGHSCSNDKYTHYSIQEKRGKEGIDAIGIMPEFKGISVHDRFSSYDKYGCEHSLCNAHLLRELKFLTEEFHKNWSLEMSDLLRLANKWKNLGILNKENQEEISNLYDKILKSGIEEEPPPQIPKVKKRGRIAKGKSLLLFQAFQQRKDQILRFIYDEKVPFDNNQAERDIRMIKLKQKISGCFRTQHGADVFCRIRSYISTVRKQGLNVRQAIENAMTGTVDLRFAAEQ